MKPGDPLPDSDHFARYCSPDKVVEGLPSGGAFKFRKKRDKDGISGNWLEYLDKKDRSSALDKVREIVGGKLKVYPEGRFVVLNVGQIKNKMNARGYNIIIKYAPTSDKSHALLGCDDLSVLIEIAEFIREQDVYPAVVQ